MKEWIEEFRERVRNGQMTLKDFKIAFVMFGDEIDHLDNELEIADLTISSSRNEIKNLQKTMILEIHSLRTVIADIGVTPPIVADSIKELYYLEYQDPIVRKEKQ